MSADSATSFYGVRYLIEDRDEIDDLDRLTHPILDLARKFRLRAYGGQYGINNERFYLFVGARLAALGAEDAPETAIPRAELLRIMADVDDKLKRAGISEEPHLYCVYKFDY